MATNDFWQQRWQDNNIGFHQAQVNEMLQEHLVDLTLNEGDTVLVPFCGASVDMLYLLEQGFMVKGTELSEIACEKFFQDNNLNYQQKTCDGFKIYESERVTLYCGDHYALPVAWFMDVNAVYDRAALNAVAPEQRPAYVEKAQALCVPFKTLLIALAYDDSEDSGPPFALHQSLLHSLYQPHQVRRLAASTQTQTVEHLQQRGFIAAVERCYLVT